jgi:hypothetical protein
MKTTKLLILSLLIVNTSFSQSKKETEMKIIELEQKTLNLESEILNIKTNLLNTTTTLALVSKSNLDLEKLVNEQTVLLKKLTKQNDSLLNLFRAKEDIDFVSIPKNEEDSIIFLIQSYYGSKKWEDRLAYVLQPEIEKSKMSEYYTDNYKSGKIKKDQISILGSGYKTNQIFKVKMGSQIVYCKKTNDGFKIDWEATIGYNQVSMITFKANLSSQPTEFRVYATIDTYYNYNYSNAQNTHWNININAEEGNIPGGYINKSSVEGKKIYDILKDGKQHQLIVELKIDATDDKSGSNAIITKVIKEGWSKE